MPRRAANPTEMLVYALSDPRTNEIKYIGQTAIGIKRAYQHYRNNNWNRESNLHKKYWIKQLKDAGLKYNVDILEECSSFSELDEAERFYIAYFRSIEAKLTNLSEGGSGERPIAPRPVELRAHLSKKNGGRPIQDEDGNIYYSKNEAARKLDIKHQQITRVLVGIDRHAGGHTFSYVGEALPKKYIAKGSRGPCSEDLKRKISEGNSRFKIKDQYGNLYNTVIAACRATGLSKTSILKILCKERSWCKGYTFIKEHESQFQPKPKEKIKIKKVKKEPMRFLIDHNGIIYKTGIEAAKKLKISRRSVIRMLSGKYQSIKGISLRYVKNNLYDKENK